MPHRVSCLTNVVFSTISTEVGETCQSQTIEHYLAGPHGFIVTVSDVDGAELGQRTISAVEMPFLFEFFQWLQATRRQVATISSS